MPAIITHHLFGEEVYAELSAVVGAGEGERDAFLLGNIGPDPLFALAALPRVVPYRKVGSTMHGQKPAELLAALHWQLVALDGQRNSVVTAYALGFLCHYLLDSSVHPLVFAQQFALCDAGVEGLTRERSGGDVHTLIETELDEYVLTTHRGITVDAFEPHREILRCADGDLAEISAGLARAVGNTYDLELPPSAFATAVRLYRAAQVVFDSKRSGVRSRFDYARLAGRHHLRTLLMTHSAVLRDDTPFANGEHFPWPHPFDEGAVVDASFDELYVAAFERALEVLPRFARSDFSLADCEALTRGVNFSGRHV